jgi:hypothetical protein
MRKGTIVTIEREQGRIGKKTVRDLSGQREGEREREK